jgi:autotransporter-associated beta strand protein
LTVASGGKVSLPGSAGGTVSNLVFAGSGSLDFDVANGGSLTNVAANGITNNGGARSITINITGTAPAFGTYTLIRYSGSLQGGGFSAYQIGATPAGGVYLLNNTGSEVQLIVSAALTWTGAQSSEWSTNLIGGFQNWTLLANPADYTNGLGVIFDDTVGAGSTTVDVSVANVTPLSVSFDNSAVNYTLQGSQAIAGASSLNKSGSGTLTVLNTNSYSGATFINAGTVQVGNGGTSGSLGSGAITDNGILQFNRSDNITVPVAISGTGAVEQNGSGVLTLAGANGYGGATTISAGTLRLGASDVLPNSSSATVNGLLDLNTFSDTINGLSGSGTVDTVAGGTSTLTVASGTFSGTIQNTAGTVSLIKTGSGTLNLGGNNTYSGATVVNAGTLAVTGDNALGTTIGTTTINGGNGSSGYTLSFTSATSDLTIAEPLNFFGNAAGRARMENNSAFNHTLNGPINVSSDTSLTEWNASGAGSITVNGDITGTMTNGAFLLLRGTSTSASNRVTGNITLTGGSFTKTDNGTWIVGTPGKTCNVPSLGAANGFFKMGVANYLTGAPVLTMGNASGASSGTLDLNGFDQTIGGIIYNGAGVATGTKTITSATAAVLTVTNATDYTSTGSGANSVVLTGALGLTKQGAGKLTLAGANTYTGFTTISGGTLVLANNSALNGTSGLSIAAGASLDTVALTLPPPGTIPLTASGTGTGVGTTAAAIIGVTGLPQDLGSRPIILNFDGANPALYISGGTLNLTNNPFTINGSVLANGVYTIIAQSDAAAVTGSVALSTVGGTALTGKIGTVSLSGNAVLLTVTSAGPTLSNVTSVTGSSYPVTLGLTGSGFTGATAVLLTNLTAATGSSHVPTVNSDTSISVSFVPGTAASSWDATVVNGTPSAQVGFTVSPPPVVSINQSALTSAGAGLVVVSGTGGTAGNSYAVLSSTNVTLPVASWTPLVTNVYGPGGSFSYTNTITPGTPRLFLRLAQ